VLQHWTHFEVAGYICALIFFVYCPPRMMKGLGGFAERHFGDSVGFYILHLGIVLVVIGGVYQQIAGIASTGNALILAAMGILKLTSKPGTEVPPGTSQTSTTSVTTATNPPPATTPVTIVAQTESVTETKTSKPTAGGAVIGKPF
jgi:hypothetical protein